MAMKKFETKEDCVSWLNTWNCDSKWIATLADGRFLGITVGGDCD